MLNTIMSGHIFSNHYQCGAAVTQLAAWVSPQCVSQVVTYYQLRISVHTKMTWKMQINLYLCV